MEPITLNSQKIGFITTYGAKFPLTLSNSRRVHCADCKAEILPGLGIKRVSFGRCGYICFACFSSELTVSTHSPAFADHDAGFFVTWLGTLQACTLNSRDVTTPEVLEAVYQSLLDQAHDSIEILLGGEGERLLSVIDAAETLVLAG